MEKSKPVIVLAGNYNQFREATMGNHNFIFGDSFEKIAGVEASAVIVVGTFWFRDNARELYQWAQSRVR